MMCRTEDPACIACMQPARGRNNKSVSLYDTREKRGEEEGPFNVSPLYLASVGNIRLYLFFLPSFRRYAFPTCEEKWNWLKLGISDPGVDSCLFTLIFFSYPFIVNHSKSKEETLNFCFQHIIFILKK